MPVKKAEIKHKSSRTRKNGLAGKDIISTELLTIEEIESVIYLVQKLKAFRDHSISTRFFDAAIGFGCFEPELREASFPFKVACNMTGISPEIFPLSSVLPILDSGEILLRLIGEAELIGIYDEDESIIDHKEINRLANFLDQCINSGAISKRPGLINIRSSAGWPVRALTDLLFIKDHFGSLKSLKHKKITISWVYDPVHSCTSTFPSSVIRLLTRFGMDVTLAFPSGYELPEEELVKASKSATTSKGKFKVSHRFKKSLQDADAIYLIPWGTSPVSDQPAYIPDSAPGSELMSAEHEREQEVVFKPEKWTISPKKLLLTREGKGLVMRWPLFSHGSRNGEEPGITAIHEFHPDLQVMKRLHLEPVMIASMILANRIDDPNSLLQEMINNER